jgi:TolB-like protein
MLGFSEAEWDQVFELAERCAGRPKDEALAWLTTQGATEAVRAGVLLQLDLGELPPDPRRHFAGERIGERIEIRRHLREGGSGAVYLGIYEEGGRAVPVAVKMLRIPQDEAHVTVVKAAWQQEQRWLREIAGSGSLPELVEAGEHPSKDGAHFLYLCTEYKYGLDLRGWCEAHGLDPWQRLELCVRVCDAVAKIHSHGLVHGDLKPENIQVEDQGGGPAVWLLDLGLTAVQGQPWPGLGAVVGTPGYMSPEQIAREGGAVSEATDVYALGMIFFELLEGRPWVDGRGATTPGVLLDRIHRRPRARLTASLPGATRSALEDMLECAAALRPQDRYVQVSALRNAVRNAMAEGGVAAAPLEAIPSGAVGAGARSTKRRAFIVGACAALLLSIAAGLHAIYAGTRAEGESAVQGAAPAVSASKLRLAVLPFENLSPDPENAFFTDGMYAEIITSLATRGPALEVVPRTTMLMYRAAPQALTKVATDLKATHIVEGTLRREADSVRLTVQLIDASTQQYVWSRTYDRKLVHALTLQSEVASEIVSQLALELASSAPELAALTTSPEAYDLYLKAKLSLTDMPGGPGERPVTLLNRALALDPSFGAAYALRAQVYFLMIVQNADPSEERYRLVRKDIDAASRLLGDTTPLVLVMEAAYSSVVTRDRAKTIRVYEAAEAAGFSDAVWRRPQLLLFADRLEEAIPLLQSQAARDPGNLQTLMNLPTMLGFSHRPIEALRAWNSIVERFPDIGELPLRRGRLTFEFSGNTEHWRKAFDQNRKVGNDDATLNASMIDNQWELLRFEQRYADLQRVLDRTTDAKVRVLTFGGFTLCCVGRRPTAVYRGWSDLLNDDVVAAAREGRAVLDFVADEPLTRWNKWFLRTLAAEGLLLTGDKQQAIVTAREALQLAPRKLDALWSRYASAVATRVFAWAGAEDEAAELLEQLAVLKPGLSPAEITRDPLYFIPLAENARYRTLAARLEEEMKGYDAELQKLNADSPDDPPT